MVHHGALHLDERVQVLAISRELPLAEANRRANVCDARGERHGLLGLELRLG